MTTGGDDALICGRCGWLTIDDECGCTPSPAVPPVAGAGVALATLLAAALAAALVVVALVAVSTAA